MLSQKLVVKAAPLVSQIDVPLFWLSIPPMIRPNHPPPKGHWLVPITPPSTRISRFQPRKGFKPSQPTYSNSTPTAPAPPLRKELTHGMLASPTCTINYLHGDNNTVIRKANFLISLTVLDLTHAYCKFLGLDDLRTAED